MTELNENAPIAIVHIPSDFEDIKFEDRRLLLLLDGEWEHGCDLLLSKYLVILGAYNCDGEFIDIKTKHQIESQALSMMAEQMDIQIPNDDTLVLFLEYSPEEIVKRIICTE